MAGDQLEMWPREGKRHVPGNVRKYRKEEEEMGVKLKLGGAEGTRLGKRR